MRVCPELDMACDRPPAGRLAPRLSPFVRGTLGRRRLRPSECPPYEGGQPWSEATGRGSITRHIALLVLALLCFGAVGYAHHGNSAYDETARVPIKGTVTEFIWTNPHSQIYLDVKDKDGKLVHWAIETNSPGILSRAGWTRRSLKAGDEVTVILCPAKNGAPVAYIGSGDPGTKVIFSDGHELDFKDRTAQ
jgi:hypothetical protein